MNQNDFRACIKHFFSVLMIMSLCNSSSLAQTITITGFVLNAKNEPLEGASISVKGTNKTVLSNTSGKFTLGNETAGSILIISYVGYKTKEQLAGGTNLVIILEEGDALHKIVVTGVMDPRTRLESSIAISVIDNKVLEKSYQVSAADALKNVPGVYVNSSLGEIRNTVYSRGLGVGSNNGGDGFYYVSMQEDGLPVTNATFGSYGPDHFMRIDATLDKLEAVRGGTASILGNNAPGGIFNYISKTGGTVFEGEARIRLGLEGNGKNPYYRADLSVGGPLSKDKSWTYNVGGFVRQSDGARYPGYSMNNGGQLRANVRKTFKKSSLTFYAKYLNDHNSWFELLSTVDFKKPRLADGVEQTNSVWIPPVDFEFFVNESDVKKRFNSKSKVHSIDQSIGMNFIQKFGNNWTFRNNARLSDKTSTYNATSVVSPFAIDGIVYYAVIGQIAQFGTYSFTDGANNLLASVTQAPIIINGQFAGFDFKVNQNNLPGQQIQNNSVFFTPVFFQENKMKEFTDQFVLTKKVKDMSFTAGGFFSYSRLNRHYGNAGPGSAATPMMSPRPTSLIQVKYQDFSGVNYDVTSPEGIALGGDGTRTGISLYSITQNQLALFFGHDWNINKKIHFDWGIRYEAFGIKGTNQIATLVPLGSGGIDGNPLTLYDNSTGKIIGVYNYNNNFNTLSFSTGLNYLISDKVALYGRYSITAKAPDMDVFINVNTDFTSKTLNPLIQDIQQIELGLKANWKKGSLFITPFYTLLKNVYSPQIFQGTPDFQNPYNPPALYNKYRTIGVELETNMAFSDHFGIRAIATFQQSKAVDYRIWIANGFGQADDSIQSYSGNKTSNMPNMILRVVPAYTIGKFYTQIEWSLMGKRAANTANAFDLPAFSQTDLAMGYNFSKAITLSVNVINVFNKMGVMAWFAPGGFPANLDIQGFTKEQLNANPDAIYQTASIAPRAYFMTLAYKF